MGSRKRARPNPKVNVPVQGPQEVGQQQEQQAEAITQPQSHGSLNSSSSQESTQKAQKPSELDSSSYRPTYTGSTWPRIQKASPSTQIARESILADKSKNSAHMADFSRFEAIKAESKPSAPDVQPDGLQGSPSKKPTSISFAQEMGIEQDLGSGRDDNFTHTTGTSISPRVDVPERPATASGWLDWFGSYSTEDRERSQEIPRSTSVTNRFVEQPLSLAMQDESNSSEEHPEPSSIPSKTGGTEPSISKPPWFKMWPKSATYALDGHEAPVQGSQGETGTSSKPRSEVPVQADLIRPTSGSTWAFWSRDTKSAVKNGSDLQDSGELAVTGESSQDKPAPAQVNPSGDDQGVDERQRKNERPKQGDATKAGLKTSPSESSKKNLASKAMPGSSTEPSQIVTSSQNLLPSKPMPVNLLLPPFIGMYSSAESPSILQQIARMLLNTQQNTKSHIYLLKDPPKIRKALAVGIHGLFPAPLLRTVIGQPTGTSVRFANHAAAAIQRWASSHGCDCEIEKVALEGEGKIAERVDNLWKLLLNWIDHIRRADFILVACHSQGVPVALMLVAKLIDFGVVTAAKIGICAMAGVSLGPFPDYKSRLFSGSAAELFDFGNPNSEVSKRYDSSLRIALKYGVRITYVGSIDDQLVSLESAIFSPLNHPYVYRAVFIDGRVHAPDFIAHLVGFALKLRNLGVSDHGLIRELSVPLAGSLYTGEGHSRLYDEVKVYDLAISFALETTPVSDIPLHIEKFEQPTNPNPFQLPWSMRGLLEEHMVKNELREETVELLKQFDEWKPATKVLKDVRYRLEAVKSKL